MMSLKKENCVYVPVPKAASTYLENLLLYNSWEPVEYNNIDWDNNFVFGFIMNPFKRYFKGATHDILHNISGVKEVIEKSINQNSDTNKNFLLYTSHTMPITTMYGSRCEDIHWIVLDKSHNTTEILQNLLNNQNIKLDIPKNLFFNKSNKKENQYYEYIRDLYKDNTFLLSHMLREDIKLYNSVLGIS